MRRVALYYYPQCSLKVSLCLFVTLMTHDRTTAHKIDYFLQTAGWCISE